MIVIIAIFIQIINNVVVINEIDVAIVAIVIVVVVVVIVVVVIHDVTANIA